MRLATPQEQCTACSNLHRSDFPHTCGMPTAADLDTVEEEKIIAERTNHVTS